METTSNYSESLDVIRASCSSIEGFRALIQRRKEEHAKGGLLGSYIIHGDWVLTEDARLGYIIANKIEAAEQFGSCRPDLSLLRRNKEVLTHDEFVGWLGGRDATYAYNMVRLHHLPQDGMACVCCEKKFTIDDLHTARARSDEKEIAIDKDDEGKTLPMLREKYYRHGNETFVMRRHGVVRNPLWVDHTPRSETDSRPLNPSGEADADNAGATPAWPVIVDWNDYIVQQGDVVSFDTYRYYHRECLVKEKTKVFLNKVRASLELAGIELEGFLTVNNEDALEEHYGLWLLVDINNACYRLSKTRQGVAMEEFVVQLTHSNGYAFYPKPERELVLVDDFNALVVHLKKLKQGAV